LALERTEKIYNNLQFIAEYTEEDKNPAKYG
jgi:hypothetical protein